MPKIKYPPFSIIIDSREQRPWKFPKGVVTEVKGLKAGDYAIKGYEDCMAIERKSLIDLFGTAGKGRERFVRELEKLAEMEYSAVVVEATWYDIAKNPPARSEMKPKAVIASLLAWSQRYGVHFYAFGSRALAARLAFRMLERFWRDKNAKKGKVK